MITPERFTEQAQQILAMSQELVRTLRHSQWDVEHILLALLSQQAGPGQHSGAGLASEILTQLGVDPQQVRQRVQQVLAQSPKMAYESTQVYATPRVVQLFDNAAAEAERLKDEFISTEHLLIAMVGERGGPVSYTHLTLPTN